MDNITKNLTISLSLKEHEDIEYLVNFFQQQSISNVSKSDVIKYLIKRYKFLVENQHNDKVREILREELSDGQ